jgi:hypothetical protein
MRFSPSLVVTLVVGAFVMLKLLQRNTGASARGQFAGAGAERLETRQSNYYYSTDMARRIESATAHRNSGVAERLTAEARQLVRSEIARRIQSIARQAETPLEEAQAQKTRKALALDAPGAHAAMMNANSWLWERDSQVEEDVFALFANASHAREYELEGKTVLCVGARLGGEVRAFMRLGALAIGYDFEPGPRNPWVLWGTGAPLQFGDNLFDYVYTNVRARPRRTRAEGAARAQLRRVRIDAQ